MLKPVEMGGQRQQHFGFHQACFPLLVRRTDVAAIGTRFVCRISCGRTVLLWHVEQIEKNADMQTHACMKCLTCAGIGCFGSVANDPFAN